MPDDRLKFRGGRCANRKEHLQISEKTEVAFRLIKLPSFAEHKYAGITYRCDRISGRILSYGWLYRFPGYKTYQNDGDGFKYEYAEAVRLGVLKANFAHRSEDLDDKEAENIFYRWLFPWYQRLKMHDQTIRSHLFLGQDVSIYKVPSGYTAPKLSCRSQVQWLDLKWDDEIPMLGEVLSSIGFTQVKQRPGKKRTPAMAAAADYLKRNWNGGWIIKPVHSKDTEQAAQPLCKMGSANVAHVLQTQVPELKKMKITAGLVRDLTEQLGLRSEARRGRRPRSKSP